MRAEFLSSRERDPRVLEDGETQERLKALGYTQ